MDVRFDVLDRHCSAGNDRAVWIGDFAGNRTTELLAAPDNANEKQKDCGAHTAKKSVLNH